MTDPVFGGRDEFYQARRENKAQPQAPKQELIQRLGNYWDMVEQKRQWDELWETVFGRDFFK